ncbi:MAG: MFS transporter, partial [Bacteroidia bacterium]
VPVWFVIGVLVTLSPEFGSANALNVHGTIIGGKAVMYHYIGASIGAFLTGILSQYLKSRKRALLISLYSLALTFAWYFLANDVTDTVFYFILFVMGIPNGYWSVFVTTASEQFGTNLRATATTTIPNFVRGATVAVTSGFQYLKSGSIGVVGAGAMVGTIVIVLAIYSSYTIDESYHKDLDYLEV